MLMLIIDQLKKGSSPLRFLSLAILVGLGILAAGLFYVQVVSSHRYRKSQVSQSFRTVRLPAVRGRIFDSQGVTLAENRPAYNLTLYLEELREYFQSDYRQRTAGKRLGTAARRSLGSEVRYGVVSNLVHQTSLAIQRPLELSPGEFHEHYNQRLALPLTIASDLQLREVARFVELAGGLPGLDLEVQPLRYYPFGALAAHTLGYLRRDDSPGTEDLLTRYSMPDYRGVAGLEGVYDDSLSGLPGVKSLLVNNLGYRHSETVWEPAEPGNNLHLTLDIRVQQTAERALRSLGEDTRGAVVVMEVESGDLLALASSPAYNPNDFIPRIRTEEYRVLLDEFLTPQFNRATGMHAPGSIFKIIVALAALESGVLQPERVYHSPGYYLLGTEGGRGRRIRDTANEGRPSDFQFKEAFKKSSNAYFVHYGLLTGLDDLVALGQRFHLGEKTALPLPELAGIFPTPEWREAARKSAWREGDTANLSIGQGDVAVTPVQMAVMTAAVANGGRVLWPRLVARVESPRSPAQRRTFPPGRVRDRLGVSESSLALVREAMRGDVEDDDGSGRQARIPGYPLGAKTGTAQKRVGGRMDHITWFVAFGPYAAPRYAVVVMIESGTSGGTTCAPLARQVFETLKDLPETSSIPPELARAR